MSVAAETRRLIVLGSTGSIGRQALDVVESLAEAARARGEPPPLRVVGLCAGRDGDLLSNQADRFGVAHTALAGGGGRAATFVGTDAAERMVREVDCEIVLGAIVGMAGLGSTLAALELGRDVALANKESLVAAGSVVMSVARRTGARLLPVDSEHAGVWQCLGAIMPGLCPPLTCVGEIARIVLTASGGPFRSWTRVQMARATPEEALRHPTWSMGPKVTVDSATLMNKALELIEAHWLFGVAEDRLDVLIHPQSIVHAMVETVDGSCMAHLGAPDMRGPIQHALLHPRRMAGPSRRLDLRALASLVFEPVDSERFPSVGLARRAMRTGHGAALNAANEVAVGAFLGGRIGLTRIAEIVADVMDAIEPATEPVLAAVVEADESARREARRLVERA
ncbi:MAG: 1-deoxy-D-xylulose-5-phosphate reductoisomerase [Phycisphaeraceae bacterium]|nr:1-deoxy-D-xylulose-5-phosphate reductoisomerase [Phycisphaeraceae bacterium]